MNNNETRETDDEIGHLCSKCADVGSYLFVFELAIMLHLYPLTLSDRSDPEKVAVADGVADGVLQ